MILVIDNYDSFVHNLARYFREAGEETLVLRNDAEPASALVAYRPSAVVLSPGPHAPKEAGVCLDLLAALSPETPLLGVCLGHQCLVEAFGGRTHRALKPLHGEPSAIEHDGEGIFEGIESPLTAGRYHSLVSTPANGGSLIVTARSKEGEVMAVRHEARPWCGVQFHPESLLTPAGRAIIRNFLRLTKVNA